MPASAAAERQLPGVSKSNIDPEDIVTYVTPEEETEYYLPYIDPSESIRFHTLRGSCDAETDDGAECQYSAAYRRVNESGIEEYCKIHAPDQWDIIMEEDLCIDNCIINLHAPCEACISSSVDSDDEDPLIRPNRCGDSAAILVTSEEPDGGLHHKSYCMAHARDDWRRALHLPTGYPDRPRLEGPASEPDSEPELFLDAPTGTLYQSFMAWEEGVNGQYPDMHSAEKHTVYLDADGSPIA